MKAQTPKELGYFFPAEWHPHQATWLTFPHHPDSFPNNLDAVLDRYFEFIKVISQGEEVILQVQNEGIKKQVQSSLKEYQIPSENITLLTHPSNDVWCRDHGGAFLINPKVENPKVMVNWGFNAWGNKYTYGLDNQIAEKMGKHRNIPIYHPQLIMEGGSIEVNGLGTLLTTEACLLNPNRNPQLTQKEIEQYLIAYYGIDKVLWLKDGIAGDDTDGHIDDMTRFINEDTVITMVESNPQDDNFATLRENLSLLKKMRLSNGKQLNIVEIEMPQAIYWKKERLPASYANFYICNSAVIVPIFQCLNDDKAISILEKCFPDKSIVGIDSTDIIVGLGSFHCLSQQEPKIM